MTGLKRWGGRGGGRNKFARVAVFASLVALLGIPTSQADNEGLYAADAQGIGASLKTFATALSGLDTSFKVSTQLPFSEINADGSDDLRLTSVFSDALASLSTPTGVHNLEQDLNFTKTVNGVQVKFTTTISPHAPDAQGGYNIDVGIDLSRAGTAPLKFNNAQLDFKGGSLPTQYALATGDVTTSGVEQLKFRYDPAAPVGERLSLLTTTTPLIEASVDFGSTANPFTNFEVGVGFSRAAVSGKAATATRLRASLADPDGNGKITETEWKNTAASDLFTVNCVTSSANLGLSLNATAIGTTPITGLGSAGAINLADNTGCTGLDAPTIALGALGDFRNLTPDDFLNAVAQVASALDVVEAAAPGAGSLPLVKDKISGLLACNGKLQTFLQNVGVWNGTQPIAVSVPQAKLDPAAANNLASIQSVAPQLATALGSTVSGLDVKYANQRLLFEIKASQGGSSTNVGIDFGNLLRGVGIDNLDGSQASLTAKPSCAFDLPLAIDVKTPADPKNPPNLLDRVFILPDDSRAEITGDFPVEGNLDLSAKIGFVELSLKDDNTSGPVKLLVARDPRRSMLNIDLGDGKNNDDQLSLQEYFDILQKSPTTTGGISELISNYAGILNLAVPKFGLEGEVKTSGGTSLAKCKVTVEWDEVGVGIPAVNTDACFDKKLLSFDFGGEQDPQMLFGLVLDALGKVADELDKVADSTNGAKLREKLPLVGKSFKDLIADFRTLKTTLDAFAGDPAGALQALERELEARLAEAIGIPADPETGADCSNAIDNDGDGFVNDGCPAVGNPEIGEACSDAKDENTLAGTGANAGENREQDSTGTPPAPAPDKVNDGCPARANGSSMLNIDLKQFDDKGDTDPSNDVGTQIIFRLGFGICGQPNPPTTTLPSFCTLKRPLTVPMSLDTGSLGGIAQVQGSGELNLYYEGSISINFGVELPRLVTGKPKPVVPAENHPSVIKMQNALAAERQCQLLGGGSCSNPNLGTELAQYQKEYFDAVIVPKVDGVLSDGLNATLEDMQAAAAPMLAFQRQLVLFGALPDECEPQWAAGTAPTCTGLTGDLKTMVDYVDTKFPQLLQLAYDYSKKKLNDALVSTESDPLVFEKQLQDAVSLALSMERQRQLMGAADDDESTVLSLSSDVEDVYVTKVLIPLADAAMTDATKVQGVITRYLQHERTKALVGVADDAQESANETLLESKISALAAKYQNVKLPEDKTAEPPPTPTIPTTSFTSPRLFVLDSTGVNLKADFAGAGTLTASLGPVQVSLGTTTAGGETGTDCDNTADDDEDTFVNDGCPAVSAAETDCADSSDNDGDGKTNDGCPAEADQARARLKAEFGLKNDLVNPGTEDTIYIDSLTNLTNFLQGMVPTSFSFRPAAQVQCAGDSGSYDACARLPVYFDVDGNSATAPTLLCRVFFKGPNIMQPSGWSFTGLTGGSDSCAEKLAGAPLDWQLWLQGLTALSTNLQKLLEGASYNVKVPVIGEALDGGAKVVKTFNDGVLTPLNSLAATIKAAEAGGFGKITSEVQTFIFTNLGSTAPIPLLQDWNADGTVDKNDVNLVGTCDDGEPAKKTFSVQTGTDGDGNAIYEDQELTVGDGVTGPTKCLTSPASVDRDPLPSGGHRVGHIKDIQLRLSIGQTLANVELPKFDVGFPGLRLATSDKLKLGVKWRLDLGIGISRDNGFYLATDKIAKNRTSDLTLGVELKLPAATSTAHTFTGELAFIRLDVDDNTTSGTAKPDLDFNIGADFLGGNSRQFIGGDPATGGDTTQKRLELNDLLNGRDPADPADFKVTVNGGVHLDLALETQPQIPGLSSDPGSIPSLRVKHFILDWDFAAGAGNDELVELTSDTTPTIALNEVELGLGKWVSDFLRPIAVEIQKYTKPMQPVIDTITTPIPVLDEMADLIGQPPPTILSILELQQNLSGNPGSLDMVKRLIFLIQFINSVPTSANANLYVPLGSFPILTAKARNGVAPDQTDSIMGAPSGLKSVLGELGQVSNNLKSKVEEAQTAKGGFSFPAFQQPTQLVQFLLGKEVTLAQYDTGVLEKEVAWSAKFGPPIGPWPASIGITAKFGIHGRFIVGYDTAGIREVFRIWFDDDSSNNDVLASAALLFQGVYVSDLDPAGKKDVPEIRLDASVVLSAKVIDLVVASAGIDGGIYGELDLNLHDGLGDPPKAGTVDGKLRIDEIASRISNPICLFDTFGSIYAKARLFAEVDAGIFGTYTLFEHQFGRGEILSLNGLTANCFNQPPPVLAKIDGNTLVLNMGSASRRGDRKFKSEVTAERFVVRQLNPAGTKFSVTFAGLTQEYPKDGFASNRLSIFADADSGDDIVDLEPGGMKLEPGKDPVQEQVPFDSSATICGGADTDTIVGQRGNDTLMGDGKEGSTKYTCDATPGSGPDTISAGEGKDTVFGGGGDDQIKGEGGDDPNLDGGSGKDNISGGFGSDTVNGQGDADTLTGGPELDPTSQQAIAQCNDNKPETPCVTAADVIDKINGGTGTDTITGEPGADELRGGDDDDSIRGTVGNDKIFGEGGKDQLFGEDGDDSIEGGTGDDELIGALGDDTLKGGDNDDDLVGGRDKGGAVGDVLEGGSGADWMIGDEGQIARTGSGRKETLSTAYAGNDTMKGEAGDDRMWGEGGADVMEGGSESDLMYGSSGADDMKGDAGDDTMYGDDDADKMRGGTENDTMRGGAAKDTMNGDDGVDTMYGDAGPDDMFGDAGSDTMRGGIDIDTMHGNADGDTMFGEDAADVMFGDDGVDTMHGDAADDDIEGNGAGDTIFGDAGQDDILGGTSTAGAADGGDTIYGADSVGATVVAGDWDVVIGDNGKIARPGGTESDGSAKRDVTVYDLASTTAGGVDTIYGEEHNDRLFGGGQGDTVNGGPQTDHIEGNGGGDTLNGNEDDDDLIGGTSQAASDFVSGGGIPDAGDTMHGNDGLDVLVGDNAELTRQSPPKIVLYDLDYVGDGATPSGTYSGGDTMFGDGGEDTLYGQGGGDTMSGGAADDYMEGNTGADTLNGNGELDDMLGGSGHDDGGQGGTVRRLDNIVDDNVGNPGAGDTLNGGADVDFMAGDNANITRPSGQRLIELYNVPFADKAAPSGELSGDDTLNGNEGNDVMYGQSDADAMSGNEDDDYMEGNAAHDVMYGNANEDNMLGGSGHDDGGQGGALRELRDVRDVGDEMHGNEDVDYMGGDNGLILFTGTTNNFDGASVGREVELYDLQLVGGTAISALVSGGDDMEGNEGDDVMFGQGNGAQPAGQADPSDGIDNDRDGREDGNPSNAGDVGYDCADDAATSTFLNEPDNDGDTLVDADDPECAAAIDEDAAWQGDVMHGNDGHDYMEGNRGADWMFGDGDEDDLAGGGSANDGQVTDDQGAFIAERDGTGLEDSGDVMRGNADDDTMLGDNGAVTRPLTGGGAWQQITGSGFDQYVRSTTMSETPEDDAAAGNDFMLGNGGNDDMFGQRRDDYMQGNDGEDAMVGDLGNITDSFVGGTGPGTLVDINPPFLEDYIDVPGTLRREVELFADETGQGAEGDDIILGNEGDDKLHGAAGNDLINGNGDSSATNPNSLEDGEDYVFGGDGDDALWGGRGHDHLYGGWGRDYLDVAPRPYMDTNGAEVGGDFPADTPEWFEIAGDDNMQGIDYNYGGHDPDAHQANIGKPGPRPGDRLIDAVGNTNIFFVCKGAYGEGVINRDELMPDMRDFLIELSGGDGASDPGTAGSSGFRELSIIFPGEESGPVHPEGIGHFTCPPSDPVAAAVSLSSASVTAGDSVTITAKIRNDGDAAAGQVVVRFSANGKEIGRQTIEGIDEGATEEASLVWNTTNLNGAQNIEVTVDPDNAITDEDETNNTASATLAIAGTDVAIGAADVALSRTAIVQGDKVTITATVRNPSTAPASNVAVRFTDNGQLIGKEQTIAAIPAGGSAKTSVVWRTHAVSGSRTLAVTADPANAIAELNEANNAVAVAVTVKPNKVKNGSYELSATGTTPDSWTASSSTATKYGQDADGDRNVSATSSSFWLSDSITVAPGTSCSVGVDAWGGTATLSVKQYSATGKAVATNSFVLQPGAALTEYTYPITIATSAATVKVTLIGGINGVSTGFDTAQLSGAC